MLQEIVFQVEWLPVAHRVGRKSAPLQVIFEASTPHAHNRQVPVDSNDTRVCYAINTLASRTWFPRRITRARSLRRFLSVKKRCKPFAFRCLRYLRTAGHTTARMSQSDPTAASKFRGLRSPRLARRPRDEASPHFGYNVASWLSGEEELWRSRLTKNSKRV